MKVSGFFDSLDGNINYLGFFVGEVHSSILKFLVTDRDHYIWYVVFK